MKRKVSPMFAVIVMLFALAVGALWFMVSYRTHAAREAEYHRVLQQQAEDSLKRREAAGRAGRPMAPKGRDTRDESQPSPEDGEGASSAAAGEGSEREMTPGSDPAGR